MDNTSKDRPVCRVEVRVVASAFILILALFLWISYKGQYRQPSNRTSGKLRTYCQAQEIFHEKHWRYGTIEELVSAGYLDEIWLIPERQHYQFTVFMVSDWEFDLVAVAMPNDYGWERNYFVDQSGVIRWADRKIPNRNSPALGSK